MRPPIVGILMTDQLRQVLRQAAPRPARMLSVAALATEVRRRHRFRVMSFAIAGLMLVAASVSALVAINTHSGGSVSTVIATPTPGSTPVKPVKPALSLSAPGPFHAGATVEMVGSGFPPNDYLVVSECPHGSTCEDPLAFGISASPRVNAHGSFSTRVTLQAHVRGTTGTYVACETACTLVVHSAPHNATVTSVAFDVIPPSLALQAPACTAAQLRASDAGSVSPETGERSVVVELENVSSAACGLSGYPEVKLLADGNVLPFQDVDGGAFILETPRSILLRPGQFAHVLVADSCCITSPGVAATTLRLTMPAVNQQLDVALPSDGGLTQGGILQIGPFAAGREVGG